MKITVNSKDFNTVLKRIISIPKRNKKSTFPALSSLTIKADENGVFMIANTMESLCKITLPCVNVEEYGLAILDYKDCEKIGVIKDLIIIENEKCGYNIPIYAKSAKKKTTVLGTVEEKELLEYYEVEQAADKLMFKVDNGQEIVKTIKTLSGALSDNPAKPIYQCYNFNSKNSAIVTIDGYRMYMRKCNWWSSNEFDVNVNGIINGELDKIVNKSTGAIDVYCDKKFISFYGEDFVYSTRLKDGQFLDINNGVIPDKDKLKAEFKFKDVKEVISVLKEYTKFSDKGDYCTHLVDYNGDILFSKTSASYKTTDFIGVEDFTQIKDYDEINVGINCSYLLEAIEVFKNNKEDFVVKYTGSLAPIILEGENYLTLVVPMRTSHDRAAEIRQDFAA